MLVALNAKTADLMQKKNILIGNISKNEVGHECVLLPDQIDTDGIKFKLPFLNVHCTITHSFLLQCNFHLSSF